MTKIFKINILFSILSLLLIYSAPNEYSYIFCLLLNLLFIFQNVLYFTSRQDKNIIGFQLIFMFAFYFTNFVYPVFYFPTNPTFSLFHYSFNDKIISKATAVAFSAYSFYILGLTFLERTNPKNKLQETINYNKVIRIVLILSIIPFLLFIITGGHKALASDYSGEGVLIEKGISIYFYIIVFISSILFSTFIFKVPDARKRIQYTFLISLFILFFVFLGSRTLPLAIALILIVSYNNDRRRIPFLLFSVLILIGLVFMAFIMFARTTSFSSNEYFKSGLDNMQINSFWDLGTDLIICNRSLYTLIDFADTKTYTFGLSMLQGILSPIPFLQSLFCNLFGIPPFIIGSSSFNTYLQFGIGSPLGLGTNVVSDVYLAFGTLGVMIFFLSLGWLIGKSELNKNTNIYWNIFYYLMVSNSVFLARSGYFDNLRTILWALGFLFIVLTLSKFKIKKFIIWKKQMNSNPSAC